MLNGRRQAAITLGAGVQWHEAYDAVQTHGRVMVGGISLGGSVGSAGGWIGGGGHSKSLFTSGSHVLISGGALSPTHGLGVDNVIQFTVVTSTGEFLTANSHQHSDLFWALRGGGAGTYGVVISSTYRTYLSTPLSIITFSADFSTSEIAQKVVTAFVKNSVIVADAGWGGYGVVDPSSLTMIYIAPNVSVDNATATIAPFFASANNATPTFQHEIESIDSFYTLYTALFGGVGQVGSNVELASRLIQRLDLVHSPDKVAKGLLSTNTSLEWK